MNMQSIKKEKRKPLSLERLFYIIIIIIIIIYYPILLCMHDLPAAPYLSPQREREREREREKRNHAIGGRLVFRFFITKYNNIVLREKFSQHNNNKKIDSNILGKSHYSFLKYYYEK